MSHRHAPAGWQAPPAQPVLHHDEVHVWRLWLEVPAPSVAGLQALLAPEEQARAARFYFARHRRRFIVARGVLRLLLGHYTGLPASQIALGYGPQGKPALVPEAPLRFNLSHAGGLALYAFALGREVGIDVERLRPEPLREGVAERFFSPREVATLRALPPPLQVPAFFACWTRKEAFIKAKGGGLSIPLAQFDVTLAPHEPVALLRTAWDAQEAARWSLQALEAAPGYAAALAVEGHGWRLRCWDYPPARLHQEVVCSPQHLKSPSATK
ncbi:MAG: 4'-phosphopantetheinyl transferase [Candidatus Tectimicrobiota bacterium]|nr:MAG: 4'-phosphopantetheinyl transferase [Candidatus Tectomicrobia bacterium]